MFETKYIESKQYLSYDFCLANSQRIPLFDIMYKLNSLILLSSLRSVIESIQETFGFSIQLNL